MSSKQTTVSSSAAATTPPAEAVGAVQLVRFAYTYMRPQLRTMILSAVFMTGATLLSVSVPVLAEEIVSYGTETIMKTASGVVQVSNATSAAEIIADTTRGSAGASKANSASTNSLSLIGFGTLSEWLVRPFLPLIFSVLRWSSAGAGGAAVGSAATSVAAWPTPYVEGIVCRCVLMGLSVVCFHFTSLIAHLTAYQAGVRAQHALTQDSVARILNTHYPERVAIVNAVKLSQIITASGRALNDTVGELLTNVLSSLMYAVGFFGIMLYLSYQLTFTILAGVVVVQCIFFFEGRALHRQGSRVTSEESSVQAFMANMLQRSETVFVFKCRDFVLKRMEERLLRVQHLTSRLNVSIHGYAAISSAFTRLILVLALGLSNYFQQKGQLDMRHTVLYFACFQSFVNTLLSLSSNVNKSRATLGRLKTLEAMLRWYSEPLPQPDIAPASTKNPLTQAAKDKETHCGGAAGGAGGVVEAQESESAAVVLDNVSFQYPAIPAFFSESGEGGAADAAMAAFESTMTLSNGARHANGIRNVSFTAAAGGITALYGPSGSGKSTCLRLLCGLVRPHAGTVHTHRRAVLLEQQHAIFIGTVAENILLTDLSGSTSTSAGAKTAATVSAEVQQRVMDAAVKSGCASFLSNPFSTLIESIDHPQFSGGQLQRIALARIFAQTDGYSLILLDEPTSGLDKSAVTVLLETLKELRDVHRKTVLISTHDHRVAEVADKVVDLSGNAMRD